jgi:hypothetical protein
MTVTFSHFDPAPRACAPIETRFHIDLTFQTDNLVAGCYWCDLARRLVIAVELDDTSPHE